MRQEDSREMNLKSVGLSLSALCFISMPIRAAEQKLDFNQVSNNSIDNFPSIENINPVCLDDYSPVANVINLIDQKKQCFDLPSNAFSFKDKTSNLKELTIPELVNITLDTSPNISGYKNNYQSYIYSSRAAWADVFDFTISISSTPSRVYSDIYTNDLIDTYNYSYSDSINTKFSGGLSMSVNLLDLAEIYDAKATSETVTSGKAELQEQAIDTVKSATSAFINYWYYNNLSEIYLSDISNSLTSLTYAFGLYQIGQNSVSDLSNILSALRASQSNYLSNLVRFNSAINSLRRYLNDREDEYYVPDQKEIDDIPVRLADLDKLFVNERLALDPTNIQNESNRKRYRYLSKSEIMNYVPTISAGASLSPSHQYSTTNNSTYTDAPGVSRTTASQLQDEVDIAAKIELSWTFFDGFSSLNQSKSYTKTSDYYTDLYDDRYDELVASSRNYLANNNLYYNQIGFLRSEAEASKFNYDKTLIAYNYGFDDTTSLIQSLSSLSSAKQSRISNLYNYYTNHINLQALLQADMFDFELP